MSEDASMFKLCPLPWIVDSHRFEIIKDANGVCIADDGSAWGEYPSVFSRYIAKIIVHRVNNYDQLAETNKKLVEALERAVPLLEISDPASDLEELKAMYPETNEYIMEIKEMARQALAIAKELKL